jgi:hypothetical protein
VSGRLLSRLAALHRRLAPEEVADAQGFRVLQDHVVARMTADLHGGPDPGPMPAPGQRWKDRQPPMSDEESDQLLRDLKRLVGETDAGPRGEDVP